MTHAIPHTADSRTTRTILADPESAAVNDDMVTDHVVARLCGVQRRTVQRWRERGVGPAYHLCEGAVRYHVNDVAAWLRSRRVLPKGSQA